MDPAQEQALVTESFRKNKSLLQFCTAVDGEIKKQIFTAVNPVFLSPLKDQLTGFCKFTALHMLQHLFSSYGYIEKIDLKENYINIMGPYY